MEETEAKKLQTNSEMLKHDWKYRRKCIIHVCIFYYLHEYQALPEKKVIKT